MSSRLPSLVLSADTSANALWAFAGREWLVTNGLGGHASGVLLGPPTRRFHGVFVPNLHAPRGRHVLLSLAHPILAIEYRRPVLETVRRELLTPLGLRTLAPADPAYRLRYEGDLRLRDGAYHQGTVWPWLLGHFADAWSREHGHRGEARAFLHALPQHLAAAGVGRVSEVFDAEPPHRPGGCIAQAWSVAELLRAWQNTAAETPHG